MRFLGPLVVLALAIVTASASAGAPPGTVAVSEVASFHYSNPLAAARTVRLSTLDGDITVTPSTDGKLDVQAIPSGKDAAKPSRMRIVAREEPAGVAVCVFFADESPDRCRVSSIEGFVANANHSDPPTVRLVARVPAGVSLIAGALNGSIHASGVTAEARVSTLNGNVDVSAATVAEATTQNGNVAASSMKAPPANAEFTTTNGDVKLVLPSGLDADVDASTMHGQITASFPITIDETFGGVGPRSGHARLGKGGAKLNVRTINGDVTVRTGG